MMRAREITREAEMEKWGWTRPQTVSIFGPDPKVQGDYVQFDDGSSTSVWRLRRAYKRVSS